MEWELEEDVKSIEDFSLTLRMGCFIACSYAPVNDPVEIEELLCRSVRVEFLELCPL